MWNYLLILFLIHNWILSALRPIIHKSKSCSCDTKCSFKWVFFFWFHLAKVFFICITLFFPFSFASSHTNHIYSGGIHLCFKNYFFSGKRALFHMLFIFIASAPSDCQPWAVFRSQGWQKSYSSTGDFVHVSENSPQ